MYRWSHSSHIMGKIEGSQTCVSPVTFLSGKHPYPSPYSCHVYYTGRPSCNFICSTQDICQKGGWGVGGGKPNLNQNIWTLLFFLLPTSCPPYICSFTSPVAQSPPITRFRQCSTPWGKTSAWRNSTCPRTTCVVYHQVRSSYHFIYTSLNCTIMGYSSHWRAQF